MLRLCHWPLWGLKKPDAGTPKAELDSSGHYAIIDNTLQAAFAAYPVPKPVHLVLSGHMDRFQTIGFDPLNALPNQLFVGNGGIALAHNFPRDPFPVVIDHATAVGFGLSEFGYMDIKLQVAGDWTGHLLDRKVKQVAECDSSRPGKTGACAPAGKSFQYDRWAISGRLLCSYNPCLSLCSMGILDSAAIVSDGGFAD